MNKFIAKISFVLSLLFLLSQCQGLAPGGTIGGGAQESTIDSTSTGYDTEGLASLPVTPPKAQSGDINALGISFEIQSGTTSQVFSFFKTAHALSAGQSLFIVGQPGTVADSAVMLLESDSGSIEFTAREDGGFRHEVPEEFIEVVLTLKYKNLAEGVVGTELGLLVDESGKHYIVTLGSESTGIHENSLTTYETEVFYNTLNEGDNQIKRRDITGGSSEVFLSTSGPIEVMTYYPEQVFDETTYSEMILGISPSKDLVKVSDSGQIVLNDFENGDTLPDGSVLQLERATQVGYKNGRLVAFFGEKKSSDNVSALTLVPINEENSDFVIRNAKMKHAIFRSASWIDRDHLLTLTRYKHVPRTEGSRTSEIKEFKNLRSAEQTEMLEYTVAQIYDFSQFGLMSFDEMQDFADRMGPVIPNDPNVLYATSGRMERAATSHAIYNRTSAYFLFKHVDFRSGTEKLAIGNYSNKAKFLNDNTDRKNVISISLFGDFIAYDTVSSRGEASIRLLHLPTLTESVLYEQEDLAPGERLLNPKFSDEYPYALTYVVGSTAGNAKVGVINLANHPWAKRLIDANNVESNGFTLDHIFNSTTLTDVPTIPVP